MDQTVKAALIVFDQNVNPDCAEAILSCVRMFRYVGSTEDTIREITIPCADGESIWNALRHLKIQFAEQRTVQVLFKGTKPLGVFTDEEAAAKALAACPDDEFEYQLEDWPLNELATRFNISVIDAK